MDNDAVSIVTKGKTKGRVKIPLDRKIEKKSHLQVSFTKRRQGLFRKASELSVLCGAEIAILVRSPAGKIFAFGSPSAEAVISRFEGETNSNLSERQIVEQVSGTREKEGRLWEKSYDGMNLQELERYALELESLAAQIDRS